MTLFLPKDKLLLNTQESRQITRISSLKGHNWQHHDYLFMWKHILLGAEQLLQKRELFSIQCNNFHSKRERPNLGNINYNTVKEKRNSKLIKKFICTFPYSTQRHFFKEEFDPIKWFQCLLSFTSK